MSAKRSLSNRKVVASILMVLLVSAGVIAMLPGAAVAAPSSTPVANTWVPNGTVNAIASNDTTTYIGGEFTSIGVPSGQGVPLDSTTGDPKANYLKVNGPVYCYAPDGSGGLYIGGDFTSVGGTARTNIARIKSDLTLDTFTPMVSSFWGGSTPAPPDGAVRTMVLDGSTLYIGGEFTQFGSGFMPTTRNYLAALDTTAGTTYGCISSWDPSAGGTVNALAVGTSAVYVGGVFTLMNQTTDQYGIPTGTTRSNLAAVDKINGTVTDFDVPIYSFTLAGVNTMVLSGTTLYVGGNFQFADGSLRMNIASINTSTSAVNTFDPAADGAVNSMALSGLNLYVGGDFTSFGTTSPVSRDRIAALSTFTGAPTAWNPGANDSVSSIAISGTTLYAGGDFTVISGASINHLAAFDTATGNVTAWDPNPNGAVVCIAPYDTTVFIGGTFSSLGDDWVMRNNIAAIDRTTGEATNWNPNSNNIVSALALNGTTVYAGGDFTNIGTQARNYIAALDADPVSATFGQATTWNPDADAAVDALAVVGTNVYAGGTFTDIGGLARNYLAAIDGTGAATSWNPNPNLPVQALTASGTTLYAGGLFSTVGGLTRNRVAAFDTTTGSTTACDPNVDLSVSALAVSNDTLYIGGLFTTVGNQSRNFIAGVNATTGQVTDWNPDADATVSALAVSSGMVYAGGTFTSIGGQARNNLAAIYDSSGSASSWNPNADAGVNALCAYGGELSIGGLFTNIGLQFWTGFARYTLAPALGYITPNYALWGTSNLDVTIYGTDTHFDTNSPTTSVATFTGGTVNGITVNSLNVESPTKAVANISISDIATAGTRTVNVVTGAESVSLTNGFTVRNPVPTINTTDGLVPNNETAGNGEFTLTVNGTGFCSTSQVRWTVGFTTQTPTITERSTTQLKATIPASYIDRGRTANVTVRNPSPGGGTSSVEVFTVNNPVPTVSGIDPATKTAGEDAFTLTVSGTGFNPTSKVRWNGTDRATTYVAGPPATLTISVTKDDIAVGKEVNITVFNPEPAGGESTPAAVLTVNNPVPTFGGMNPIQVPAENGAFDLTVTGTNFNEDSVVTWNDSNRETTFVSATELRASILADDVKDVGTADVKVVNPAPGGGSTDPFGTFTITGPPDPTITAITPNKGDNTGVVGITNLEGTGFLQSGVLVQLKKGAQTITGTDVTVVSGTKITCKFDLTGAQTGAWDLYVENTKYHQSATSAGAFTVELPAPTVASIDPSSIDQGTAVLSITVQGANFQDGVTAKLKKSGKADINATNVNFVSANQVICTFNTSGAGAGKWDLLIQNPDGKSVTKAEALEVIAPAPPPPPPPVNEQDTWYLAEGTTAWGFTTYISIQNPNTKTVPVEITYMTSDGNKPGGTLSLPAMSQTTVNPADTLGSQDFSTMVTAKNGETIAVDRTMKWTASGAGPGGAAVSEAHCSIGVNEPATTWYLPEGSTNWGFETWLLIQNPNNKEATCQVTYMIEGEGQKTLEKKVPANSRKTYNMLEDVGNKDASIKVVSDVPVIPERAMYRNNKSEGHDSIGTTTPANDYYLAEGAVGYDPGFITYVLVQNPNDKENNVTITYLTGAGEIKGKDLKMPANSRKTVRVNDELPPATDVSTHVHGDLPVIAERAIYWNAGSGEACHDSIGMAAPHTSFYLPDGEAGTGAETWTLVSNPNGEAVKVKISYLSESGTGNQVFEETIPANSRMTFDMVDKGVFGRAAVLVQSLTSGKKIMVERAMYWDNRGAGTDTIGGFSD